MNSSILEIVTAEISFLPCKRELIQQLDIDAESLKMTRTASTATCHLIFTSEYVITYQ